MEAKRSKFEQNSEELGEILNRAMESLAKAKEELEKDKQAFFSKVLLI